MKKNVFSIFSIWKKYKILFCLNLAMILVLSSGFSLAGSRNH